MKNRYGIEYNFEKVSDRVYRVVGDLKYWRYGGQEGQSKIDYYNLSFADPQGGPFIGLGYLIDGQKVENIRLDTNGDLLFTVDKMEKTDESCNSN